MTYMATVVNVMIASPSDVPQERQIVRKTIEDWNAIHSRNTNLVLMPNAWESHASPELGARPQEVINKQILQNCDLLIAVFWTRIGSSTGKSLSGTVEEIEEHVKAGRPAMIYFSSVPVRLDSVDNQQYEALKSFKDACRKNGLVEEYGSLSEFREKLFRQLSQKIIEKYAGTTPRSGQTAAPSEPEVNVSPEAHELLIEASLDANGVIASYAVIGGYHVSTNNKDFIKQGDARSVARWRASVEELERLGCIEDRGGKREIFFVTDRGYQVADDLRYLDAIS